MAVLPRRPASLARRLACFVYEGVLLFGVVMVTALIYAGLTQQRNALSGRHGLQVSVFVVLAAYFTWFWSHGGQTVAMKAWSIRLVTVDGSAVSPARACMRYLSSWMWFVPALAAASFGKLASASSIFMVLGIGIVGYAAFAWRHPTGQFVHDVLCGTGLDDIRTVERPGH